MKTKHWLSMVGRWAMRPQNWLIIIILLPVLAILCIIAFFCFLIVFYILMTGVVYPITDPFFPEKPLKEFLQHDEYKIVKFIRHGDFWGEIDYTWYLKFPKGFNSVDAIPFEFEIECIEYNTNRNELDNFPSQGKKYIVYPNRLEYPTKTWTYIPGKEPEDLLLEYQSR